MPDLISALALLVAALNVGVFLYGAYWALEIRKALAAPLYKRQSLWVGVIGSLFALFFLVVVGLSVGSVSDVSGNSVATFTVAAFIYVITVMFFVWIDSTMKIARRSDPLRRNTLRWSGLRWFLGFLAVIGTLFALFSNPKVLDFSRASPLYGPIGLTLFLGAVALLLSARRSGDSVLRNHLKWFGLFSGFLWISTAILQADAWNAPIYAPTANLATHIAFGISAYFLYRSAKSLVALQPAPVIVQRA